MTRKKRLIGLTDDYDSKSYRNKSSKLINSLDPELLQYFDEAGISTNRTKSKKSTCTSRFTIGDQVSIKGKYGTIIYGPYKSSSNKDTYEIETEDNQIITSEDDGKSISLYVPPIEENETEDLF